VSQRLDATRTPRRGADPVARWSLPEQIPPGPGHVAMIGAPERA
jgi:hypothetical protein